MGEDYEPFAQVFEVVDEGWYCGACDAFESDKFDRDTDDDGLCLNCGDVPGVHIRVKVIRAEADTGASTLRGSEKEEV